MELLKKCLQSLSGWATNVVVGINGQDKESLLFCKNQNYDFESFHFVELEACTPAAARNCLLKYAKDDWVYFIDDDAEVTDMAKSELKKLIRSNSPAEIIGGPNLTPNASNMFQRASGVALSSRFGSFLSAGRYRADGAPRLTDDRDMILCNMVVNRHAISNHRFKEHLVCNEENWLLQEMQENGNKIYYDPKFFVFHERRKSIFSFFKQVLKYGIGRGQNTRGRPKSMRWPHCFPSLCLVLGFISIFSAISSGNIYWLFPFFLYIPTSVCAGLFASGRMKETLSIGVFSMVIFPVIHIAYGLGFIRGFLKREISI